MPAHGIIKYIRDGLDNELRNPQGPDKETEYAKYTMGMLHDILDRIDYTIETRTIAGPAQLTSATIKTLAAAAAILIMEVAREGRSDKAKDVATDQFKEELGTALEMYKTIFEKHKAEWL